MLALACACGGAGEAAALYWLGGLILGALAAAWRWLAGGKKAEKAEPEGVDEQTPSA